MGFWKTAGNIARGIGKSIVQTATDIKDIGAQVVGGVVDAGKAVLEGGKTLITDPVQFAKDVGNGVKNWGDHMKDSWNKGVDTIESGIEDAKNGRSLWHAFGNTVKGVAQIGSLGISDAWDDHLEASMIEETDDMGNVVGYSTKEGTDAFTRIFVRDNGDDMALNKNAEAEIHEALAEGDVEKARDLDHQRFMATTGKDLAKVGAVAATAGTVASVVLIPFTGGASTPAALAMSKTAADFAIGAGTAAAVAGTMTFDSNKATFDVNNVRDDAADAASELAANKVASGELDPGMEELYAATAQTVYEVTGYNGVRDYAEQAGFESKEDMIDFAYRGAEADVQRESVTLAAAADGTYEAVQEGASVEPEAETPEVDPDQEAQQAENMAIMQEALGLA